MKNVARGLSAFLLGLLPPICDHENNLNIIMELCKLAVLILQIPRTSGNFNFDAVICFMEKLLTRYGSALGCTSDNLIKAPIYGEDIGHIVKSLMWKIIETEQECRGLVWTSPINVSEQINGQSAYETKSVPIQKSPMETSNMESVSGVLSFLTRGLVSCPEFILTVPAISPTDNGSTIDHDDSSDFLIRRAAGTASMSLDQHHDKGMVQSAVVFLMSLVRSIVLLLFPSLKIFFQSNISHNIYRQYY